MIIEASTVCGAPKRRIMRGSVGVQLQLKSGRRIRSLCGSLVQMATSAARMAMAICSSLSTSSMRISG